MIFMNAGLCLKWWRSVLQSQSYGALDESVAAVPPGSGGLLFLPYLNGERTPHLNPNISGAFLGLNLGSDCARMIPDVTSGKQVEKTTMIPFVLVTKDNVDQYLK